MSSYSSIKDRVLGATFAFGLSTVAALANASLRPLNSKIFSSAIFLFMLLYLAHAAMPARWLTAAHLTSRAAVFSGAVAFCSLASSLLTQQFGESWVVELLAYSPCFLLLLLFAYSVLAGMMENTVGGSGDAAEEYDEEAPPLPTLEMA